MTIFTHANWWKNLQAGMVVPLRIQGQDRKALVEKVVEDKLAIASGLTAHLSRVPSDAKWYGVKLDGHGNPNEQEVNLAVQTVVMIRFQLG